MNNLGYAYTVSRIVCVLVAQLYCKRIREMIVCVCIHLCVCVCVCVGVCV